ncbi:MAG: molybdate ABC transporter substrate-binding protein [Lentisphaerae bacterium]|nr:molybdate ABC transporter substrate-binding protein [Lentisphaerota bacterium]
MCYRLLGVGVAVLLLGCGKKTPGREDVASRPLTIYVPCGMELPFMAAEKAFEAANPGTDVAIVLDNANILVKRIMDKGEYADLIVSPGTVEVDKLVAKERVRADDIKHFARYELTLFAPRANPGNVKTMADLTNPEVKVISIAEPEENSVGRYTRQALQKAGLWDKIKDKTEFTEHPITAYKHVAREKAQASFAYRSCPLKTAPDKLEYSKIRILEKVPFNTYGPAYACIAPLLSSQNRTLADKFVSYLLSKAGQDLLKSKDVPALTALRLFVPCGMMGPFFNVRSLFERENPEITLDLIFDRADALTDRITKEGDAPDVHFSIGKIETDLLVQAGKVAPDAPKPFGTFELALCAHVSRLGTVGCVKDLTKPEVKSILLTPPENSSVGFYAKSALEKLGLWEQVSPKITYLPTIKDCYKEVSAGRTDASFAYVGCPIPCDPEKAEYSKVKPVEVLAKDTYGGAVTYASVLKGSEFPEAAGKVVAFLKRKDVLEMLSRVGLKPVE